MRYAELTRKLRRLGCEFYRQRAGSHEMWVNDKGESTTIPNGEAGTCGRVRFTGFFGISASAEMTSTKPSAARSELAVAGVVG